MLAAEPKPTEQPTVPKERPSVDDVLVASLRDEFVPDRCVTGDGEWDYLINVRSKYVAYREDAGRKACEPAEFEEALQKIDGVSISNGKVRGLRLKRTGELVADAMTAASAESSQ